MNTLLQDLRYAVRTLRRSPGSTGVAVLCLALGIGVNTTIFGAFNATFLRPLPFANHERLVAINEVHQVSGQTWDEVAYPNLVDWTEDGDVFAAAAAYDSRAFNLTDGGVANRVGGSMDRIGQVLRYAEHAS